MNGNMGKEGEGKEGKKEMEKRERLDEGPSHSHMTTSQEGKEVAGGNESEEGTSDSELTSLKYLSVLPRCPFPIFELDKRDNYSVFSRVPFS